MMLKKPYWLTLGLVFPILLSACSRNFGPAAPAGPPPVGSPTSSGNTPGSTATVTSGVTATSSATAVASASTDTPTPAASAVATPTATNSGTATSTPTGSATSSPSPSETCAPALTLNFTGNLNSAQPADSPGGVLNLGTYTAPTLPLSTVFFATGVPGDYAGDNSHFTSGKMNMEAYGPGSAIFQIAELASSLDTQTEALPHHATVLLQEAVDMGMTRGWAGNYAWEQNPSIPAGVTVVKSLIDVAGNPRQVTFLFYQVNDIGTASPPVNPNPPHQAAWAWYAFDTTGGKSPATSNLIDGTGILQCSFNPSFFSLPNCFVDRGVAGDEYWGELIYFNSDGSLASEGAAREPLNLVEVQAKPEVILPPLNGWPSFPPASMDDLPVTPIGLNFGTAGMPGYGQRDGLTGDAAPSNVH